MARGDPDKQFAQALLRTLKDPVIAEAFEREEANIVNQICATNSMDREQLLALCCQLKAVRTVSSIPAKQEQRDRLKTARLEAVPDA